MNERKIHIIYWKWKPVKLKEEHGNNKIKEKRVHDEHNEGQYE